MENLEEKIDETIEQELTYKEEYNKVLNNYFDIDNKNKSVLININFDSIDDLLDYSIGNKNKYLLNQTAIDKIIEVIKLIPPKYKLDLNINIKDLKETNIETLKQDLITNYAFYKLYHFRNNKKTRFFALSLLISGIIFLLLNIIFFSSELFPSVNNVFKNITSEILDIIAWVFIWESATIYFIDLRKEKFKEKAIKKRVKNISITNNK